MQNNNRVWNFVLLYESCFCMYSCIVVLLSLTN